MTDTKKMFDLAQLDEASYANLALADKVRALTDSKFSATQAADFVTHWEVVHHQPDTSTGFSATLFVRLDDDPVSGYQAGQYVFAIRGSTFDSSGFPFGIGKDFQDDIGDIFADGIVLDQLVDMYNYWQQLKAPEGQGYQIARLLPIPDGTVPEAGKVITDQPGGVQRTIQFFQSDTFYGAGDPRQFGLGQMDGGGALEVTGHSLGGHLAAAFTRLFPETGAQALGVNGLGFRDSNPNVDRLFSMLGGAEGFDGAAFHNLYGLAGPEVAAQDSNLLAQVGEYDGIYIEDYLSTWGGHSVSQMTDSLAVYDLFIRLDSDLAAMAPGEALASLTPLFKIAGNEDDLTLENLTGALHRLLVDKRAPRPTGEYTREELYQVVLGIRDASAGGSYTLQIAYAGTPRADIVAAAQDDIAWRYALMELNPFALIGADYETLHNVDGSLDLYDPETGEGNMSELYLNDRAAMLTWKLKYDNGEMDENDLVPNILGGDKSYGDEWDTSTVEGNWDFVDYGIRIPGIFGDSPLTLAIDGTGLSTSDHQIAFGSKNAESITGAGDVDHLYGMAA